jgi:hypothetical protein
MMGGGHGGGRECDVGERHGEERGWDAEEGRWECQLSSRCRHHGYDDKQTRRTIKQAIRRGGKECVHPFF